MADNPEAADALATDALANPKSMSLAPVLVSMMLPRFKSFRPSANGSPRSDSVTIPKVWLSRR